MKTRTKLIVTGALALVAVGGTAGAVTAASGDNDTGITGPARDHAARVSLDRVGDGRVTATEVGDEEGYYQVEITKNDGTQVDVNLDKDFNVIKTKTDRESSTDSGS
ncbi:MAG: hypothetical protein H0W70_04360 [Actinobacteria bacterium]|nr:hypothetical protein [Actinomycetota bacterium]